MTLDGPSGGAAGNQGIPRRMIAISLLIHLFALSLFLLSPKAPKPELNLGSQYMVNLVSAVDLQSDQGSSSKIPPRELEAPPAPKKEEISRNDAVPLSPSQVRKMEPVKKVETPSVNTVGKAIAEIRRRVEAASQKPSYSTSSGIEKKSGQSPVIAGPTGTVDDAELGARMKAYYGSIWTRIKRRWSMPPDLLPRENIEAIIHVRIFRNGSVEGVSFEKRSGNSYFDESAIRAVRKASPFPPLPEGIGENGIEMGIRFHSSELQ